MPFTVQVGPRQEQAQLYESRVAARAAARGEAARLVRPANPLLFRSRPGIYGDTGGDYRGQRAAVRHSLRWRRSPCSQQVAQAPVLLHAHDWHTALAPVVPARTYDIGRDFYRQDVVRSSRCITRAFRDTSRRSTMADLGLPWELYNLSQLEWYGRVNLLKGGMAFADAVTTVSPTHAHELRTAAGGFGLHERFIALRERFVGIVNGIDTATGIRRPTRTSPPTTRAKASAARRSARRRCSALFGLPQRPGTPIFGMSARIVSQKGLDLILGSPRYLVARRAVPVPGAGREALRGRAHRARRTARPAASACKRDFTDEQEHRLLAGADMILMPSQYEPCGLTQMRAQRYGTHPGRAQRRWPGRHDRRRRHGIPVRRLHAQDFIQACARAIDHYQHPETWPAMVREAMSRDFGWHNSEAKYRELYRRVLESPRWRR